MASKKQAAKKLPPGSNVLAERWDRIRSEIDGQKLSPVGANISSIARIPIEFLRETALIHDKAGDRYRESDARKLRAKKYATKAKLELKRSNHTEQQCIENLGMIEAALDLNAGFPVRMIDGTLDRNIGFPVRDDLLENLMLLWKQWGGKIGASFNNRSAGGPLVRFLLACSDDLFPLTAQAARARIQKFAEKTRSIK
jgi:hypothetical protein